MSTKSGSRGCGVGDPDWCCGLLKLSSLEFRQVLLNTGQCRRAPSISMAMSSSWMSPQSSAFVRLASCVLCLVVARAVREQENRVSLKAPQCGLSARGSLWQVRVQAEVKNLQPICSALCTAVFALSSQRMLSSSSSSRAIEWRGGRAARVGNGLSSQCSRVSISTYQCAPCTVLSARVWDGDGCGVGGRDRE